MQEEEKDEHDIKKMQECIQETSETLVTCKPRIEAAIDDLESTIALFDDAPDGPAKELLKAT